MVVHSFMRTIVIDALNEYDTIKMNALSSQYRILKCAFLALLGTASILPEHKSFIGRVAHDKIS